MALRRAHVGLALIIGAYAAVSFTHLKTWGVFDDEAIYVWSAHLAAYPHHLSDFFGTFTYAAPPLFTWLGALALHVVTDPLVALRSVSVLCGAGILASVYALALQLYSDARIGLLAALLCAFCPYDILFDRLALLDPLVALIGLLVALQSVHMFRRGSPGLAPSIVLGLLLGCGQLAKGISIFFWLLPLLSWYFYAPGRALSSLKRAAVVATPVAAVVYAVVLASGDVRNLFRPFFTAIKYSVATPYPGYYASHPHASLGSLVLNNLGLWLSWQQTYIGYPLLGVLLVTCVAGVLRRNRADVFLILWLAIPLAAMLFVKIYTSRYVLFTVPIELLLVSRALIVVLQAVVALARHTLLVTRPRILRMGAAGLLLLGVAFSAVYTVAFDLSHDLSLIRDPATAALVDDDRWQYVAGWPAGFGLDAIEAYIQGQARFTHVVVLAAPAHQPINALLYGFSADPHVDVQPVTLTDRTPVRASAGKAKPLVFAVLNVPKEDPRAIEAAHPNWKLVMRQPKPDNQSEFLLLSAN
jgi:4-amino-4-deoxy-L-arabinose transferase-like glycosyltransferase